MESMGLGIVCRLAALNTLICHYEGILRNKMSLLAIELNCRGEFFQARDLQNRVSACVCRGCADKVRG